MSQPCPRRGWGRGLLTHCGSPPPHGRVQRSGRRHVARMLFSTCVCMHVHALAAAAHLAAAAAAAAVVCMWTSAGAAQRCGAHRRVMRTRRFTSSLGSWFKLRFSVCLLWNGGAEGEVSGSGAARCGRLLRGECALSFYLFFCQDKQPAQKNPLFAPFLF